jgi:hypothetical protein
MTGMLVKNPEIPVRKALGLAALVNDPLGLLNPGQLRFCEVVFAELASFSPLSCSIGGGRFLMPSKVSIW